MEEEWKKLLFLFVFSTYLPVFFTQILSGRARWIKFCIQRVPTLHTFDRPHYPKNKKYLKKCDDDVLVGCGIKLRIQRTLPINFWVKTRGYMLKIWTKKLVFYDKYVNSTIMVDSFYWNSIGYWIPTHKNLLLDRFLIRPILDPKFPLIIWRKIGCIHATGLDWTSKPPRWTNELPNHLKWSQMPMEMWLEHDRT